MRNIKILGTGKYLPENIVKSEDIDLKCGVPRGTVYQKTGVLSRRYVSFETTSEMAAFAAKQALVTSGLEARDLDVIITASGCPEQLIPSTGPFVQKRLGLETSGIPSFDINATCLSFVLSLDLVSTLLCGGRFKNALIVSPEIASVGLNYKSVETGGLFGDGAAAAVVGLTPVNEPSGIIKSYVETYSEGIDTCEIRGGGTKLHSTKYNVQNHEDFLFRMDGKKVFKLAAQYLPQMMSKLFEGTGLSLNDVKLVIPHQASQSAMSLVRRRLEIREDQWMDILENHGNCIAASVPMALHEAVTTKRLQRGDLGILLGTSAGFSLSLVLFRY